MTILLYDILLLNDKILILNYKIDKEYSNLNKIYESFFKICKDWEVSGIKYESTRAGQSILRDIKNRCNKLNVLFDKLDNYKLLINELNKL
jgi:hypothetical protein